MPEQVAEQRVTMGVGPSANGGAHPRRSEPADEMRLALSCLERADRCIRAGGPDRADEALQLLRSAAAHLSHAIR